MVGNKVLIVEDDKKIAELLKDYFTGSGFNASILTSGNGVVTEVKSNPPDIIILDIMLPIKDGMTICKEIREFSNVPILMLTAKVEEIDRVLGLELGADDYICKPFSPREVVARVKAIFRRATPDKQVEEKLVAGPITITPDSHNVTIEGKPLRLTPNEFELLKLMASRPDYVFTRNDLVSYLQGYDFEGSERIIDSHIKNMRKKIDEAIPGNSLIQTIYGIGYSLNVSRHNQMPEMQREAS